MSHPHADSRPPIVRPGLFRRPRIRIHFTFAHLWRLFIASLMVSLYVIGTWSGMLAQAHAYAASLAVASSSNTHTVQHPTALQGHRPPAHPTVTPDPTPPAHHRPARTTGTDPKPPAQHPLSGSPGSVDGLGVQSFYTYVSQRLTDRTDLKVNVANGNLVLHDSVLHIRGTGLDLSMDTYYNPQAVESRQTDLSMHWNLSTGYDVYLDLSQSQNHGPITFYGPSGYSAVFNSNGSGGYLDPLGLNATLTTQSSDGAYHLDFHQTKETFEFGSSGRLIDDEDKNGNQLTFAYNGSNQLSTITDSQNRVTTFTYYTSGSAAGQLKLITDPANRTVQYSYDANGNLSSITDTDGKVTSFGYEAGSDDLTSITDPLNNLTTIAYGNSSLDQVASITDATGNASTTFSYNSSNTVVTDRNGNATTYTYDTTNLLRIASVTDALNHTQTTQFDTNDDMTQYGDALGDLSAFGFAPVTNNLSTMTDGNLATTSFGYPTPGSQNQYFPLTQTDPQTNQTDYTYDSNGNLLSAANHVTGNGLTYTYNANGTIATEKDANGNKTSFGYDGQGNLTSVTPPSPLGAISLSVGQQLSRVNSVTDGNGNTTSYTYDKLDRVTSISYSGGGTISYTYDADGNLLSETDNTGTTSFTYNALNRLKTKALPGGAVITTGYDKDGNLTSFTDGGGKVTYVYDAANRMTQLIEPDGAT